MKIAKIFIAKRAGVFLSAVHLGGKVMTNLKQPDERQIDCLMTAILHAGAAGADRVLIVDNSKRKGGAL